LLALPSKGLRMLRSCLLVILAACSLLTACQNMPVGHEPIIHGASATLLPDLSALAVFNARGNSLLLASTDLPDLRAIIAGVGGRFDWESCRRPQTASDRQQCWLDTAVPARSLFIAGDFIAPCANTDLNVEVQGSTLKVLGSYSPIDCGGRGSLPQPTFSVIAVPLRVLPTALVTIVFDNGNPPSATMVDLRPLVPTGPPPDQRYSEVVTAMKAITTASNKRGVSEALDEFAVLSWPDVGSGCRPAAADQRLLTRARPFGRATWSGLRLEQTSTTIAGVAARSRPAIRRPAPLRRPAASTHKTSFCEARCIRVAATAGRCLTATVTATSLNSGDTQGTTMNPTR
jgi:hypothetical protein